MNICNKLLILAVMFASALPIVGCSKAQDRVHPSWAPPRENVVLDDSAVTANVKSALQADPDLGKFDLEVEATNGEVQLSGSVENQAQIDRAAMLAWMAEGVKKVNNKISLLGAAK